MTAADGAYVTYRADEQWAVLCLESHRNHCRVIGENLGTVPKAVNDRMVAHAVGQLFVVQYELNPAANPPLREPPPNCAASLNTHDMAMFAHYWEAGDSDDRVRLGMLEESKAPEEREGRARARRALGRYLAGKKLLPAGVDSTALDVRTATEATLALLAQSEAEVVLVNVEDLWQEKRWQNIPGTLNEHPNWQHKLAKDLDAMRGDAGVNGALRAVEGLRSGGSRAPEAKPVRRRSAKV
jgi:4-alpha-glucanotransferase